MQNPFEGRSLNLSGPGLDLMPIVPDDAVVLPVFAMALHVETGGAIVFETIKGNVRTLNVPDHSILPVGVRRVLATGTTATGIHGYTA